MLGITKTLKLGFEDLGENEYDTVFPHLMFCIRDFGQSLADGMSREVAEQKYLEDSLQESGTSSSGSGQVRGVIKKCFPPRRRNLFTVRHPWMEAADIERKKLKELRPEFLGDLARVCNFVDYKSNLPADNPESLIKKLRGAKLNGPGTGGPSTFVSRSGLLWLC